MEIVTYRLFGIPVWSVRRTIEPTDEMYDKMRIRFSQEVKEFAENQRKAATR